MLGAKLQLAREIVDAMQHFQRLVVAEPARVFGERLRGDPDAGHVVAGRFHGVAHLTEELYGLFDLRRIRLRVDGDEGCYRADFRFRRVGRGQQQGREKTERECVFWIAIVSSLRRFLRKMRWLDRRCRSCIIVLGNGSGIHGNAV